ncbi:MAG: extracellular solute-binding protein [Puniceicoccales bacterium]|nr:extracellular solute-binding protein [Puniceicoccales bacterium]
MTILALVSLVIAIPFLFRSPSDSLVPANSEDVLVIITAHNEALRREYSHGFQEWYRRKTGRKIVIDWRHPGGGRDVARYVDSMFLNHFRLHWEGLGRRWSQEIRGIFLRLEEIGPQSSSLEREVRDIFLNSRVGCGVDLFFGGGVFEHQLNGRKGYTVDSRLQEEHPELFAEDKIPAIFAGERLYDENGLWYGGSLSTFEIIYNEDALKELGIEHPPRRWMDLANPKFFRGIAIVDPSKSSSTLKSFEMLVQQQMQESLRERQGESGKTLTAPALERQAVEQGWIRGLQLLQKIIANGRYFTDSSGKTVTDVAAGNCPVGIAVDFYSRAQRANIQERAGVRRFASVLPRGGGAPSPDPISLFRGARHPAHARAFMEYILSLSGQKLLAFKLGVSGGPVWAPLCRTPILKTVYGDEYRPLRLEGYENPYESADAFVYHPEWTKPVHNLLGAVIKTIFLDTADELSAAWEQIIRAQGEGRAQDAAAALGIFSDMRPMAYSTVCGSFAEIVHHRDPLFASRRQMDLSNRFRRQYQRAASRARGEK